MRQGANAQPLGSLQEDAQNAQLRQIIAEANTARPQQAGISSSKNPNSFRGIYDNVAPSTLPPSAGVTGNATASAIADAESQSYDPSQVVKVTNQDALDLYNRLVQGGATQFAKDSRGNLSELQKRLLGSYSALDALMRSGGMSGVNAGIKRDYYDRVMPEINQAAEAGGSNANALSSYLRGSAQAKLSEAQARVGVDATLGATGNQAQLANALTNAAQNDPVFQQLLALAQAGGSLPDTVTLESLLG
jgi:hypothetical protein